MEALAPETWYQRATLYQINDDIAGIIRHLGFLNDGGAESLGIGAILVPSIYGSEELDWLSRDVASWGMKLLVGDTWRSSHFNLDLTRLPWGRQAHRQFIDEYEACMGPDDWPNYTLGSLDGLRVATRVGASRARLLAMLQMTLRGLPMINHGEELGKQSFEVAERQPGSMLQLYRRLIHLRDTCPALSVGDYRSMELGDNQVYGYIRETLLQRFLILLNFSGEATNLELRGPAGVWVAGTQDIEGDGLVPERGKVTLQPYEGRMYELVR
jgi:hypothetical protein